MTSAARGVSTSPVEVTNISQHGFWLLLGNEEKGRCIGQVRSQAQARTWLRRSDLEHVHAFSILPAKKIEAEAAFAKYRWAHAQDDTRNTRPGKRRSAPVERAGFARFVSLISAGAGTDVDFGQAHAGARALRRVYTPACARCRRSRAA